MGAQGWDHVTLGLSPSTKPSVCLEGTLICVWGVCSRAPETRRELRVTGVAQQPSQPQ